MTAQQTGRPEPPKRPLFRPEAVEHHARARLVTGGGLDLRERVTTWLFRALLAAMAVAVLLAFTIHVDRAVAAAAVVDRGGDVRFALPPNLTDSLRAGQEITFRTGDAEYRGTLRSWQEGDGGVLAVADVPEAPRGEQGRVVLRLGRQSIAEQLTGRS